MEVIHKSCWSWPYKAYILTTISIFHEDISLVSFFVKFWIYGYSRINNRDISELIRYFFHLWKRKVLLIDCEILKINHVIDITPNCIKGQSCLFIFFNNLLQCFNWVIAPFRLMKSQRPERWNSNLPNAAFKEFVYYIQRLFSKNKSEIKYSAYHFISKIMFIIFLWFYHIHSMCTLKITYMRCMVRTLE